MRNRPGRSVTSSVPSGNQVSPHGCSSDSTRVTGRGVGDWASSVDASGAAEGDEADAVVLGGAVLEGVVADEVHPTSIRLNAKALTIEREQFFLVLAILTVAIV